MPDDAKRSSGPPYETELRHIAERLALLDEADARNLLEDFDDIAETLISQRESRGKPAVPLKDMRNSLGLER